MRGSPFSEILRELVCVLSTAERSAGYKYQWNKSLLAERSVNFGESDSRTGTRNGKVAVWQLSEEWD